MARLKLTCWGTIALLLLPLSEAEAKIQLKIEDIQLTQTGGVFLVSATPESEADREEFASYAVNLLVDNFQGSIPASFGLEMTNLLPGIEDAGPDFGSTETPTQVQSGDVVQFVGLGLTQLELAKNDLLRINLDVPGGFSPGDAFDVSVLPNDPASPLFNITSLGFKMGDDLTFDSVTIGDAAPPMFDACDVDKSGACDAADIDLLSEKVRNASDDLAFDLNGSGTVDGGDREFWVIDLMNTYFGDSTLDGVFDSGDLIQALSAGEFEDDVAGNSTWADGDWSGDTEFDTSDLIVAFAGGGYEVGARAATAAVPEPTGGITTALVLLLLATRRKS